MEEKPRLLILYATETGNALDAAERIEREAEHRQCSATLLSMDEFKASCLPNEDAVIFIVSTTGQGDIPDSMKAFWRFLLRRNLSQQWLEGVLFAVFGLGDSGYQKYNFTAKKLDKRLASLGAKPIIKIGLGDDQHPSGYEGALDPWLSSLWEKLKKTHPTIFKSGIEISVPDMKLLCRPKVQIVYHNPARIHPCVSSSSDLKITEMQIGRARSMSPARYRCNDYQPQCFLHMTKNQLLTKMGSERDVRHFEFEVLSSDVEYQVGDVLEILPRQDPVAVDAFIQHCNLDPDSYITVHQTNKNNPPESGKTMKTSEPINLRTFVELTMDVGSASPRRYFFEVMSFFATVAHEKEKLQYFASPEGRDDLHQYNQKERRTVLEVLEDFPSVQMPFEWLVQLVPPLKTRSFSISSSPLAHPNQVHLTVSVVSWVTPFKRKRRGLCSTWLAGLDPVKSVPIPAWFHRGSLPSPPPSLPLILIGPGTGCAPFRGFIEERAILSRLQSTGAILFFFGCRNEDNDFLYRDFWFSQFQSFGVLSEEKGGGFFVAFSRDQPRKVYVQHKMQEQRERIWNLLRDGAAIYIAGSATKMPEDVTSALEEIISKENEISRESAARMLTQLEKVGRFNIEAWS